MINKSDIRKCIIICVCCFIAFSIMIGLSAVASSKYAEPKNAYKTEQKKLKESIKNKNDRLKEIDREIEEKTNEKEVLESIIERYTNTVDTFSGEIAYFEITGQKYYTARTSDILYKIVDEKLSEYGLMFPQNPAFNRDNHWSSASSDNASKIKLNLKASNMNYCYTNYVSTNSNTQTYTFRLYLMDNGYLYDQLISYKISISN